MTSAETIELGGDATKLIAAYKAANQAAEDNRHKASQYAADTKREAQEENRLIRDAKKATEERIPAQERLASMSMRYNDLVRKGRISQDEANAALARQKKLLDDNSTAAGGLQSQVSSFGKEAVVAFTGIGSALAGVMATVNIIKTEYEDLKRRQKESLDSQLSFGDQIREMAANFGEDDTLKKPDLEGTVLGIAQRTGATPEVVAQVMGKTLSAKGDLTNAQAADVVEQALRVLPSNAEDSKQLASRAADLMGAGGVDSKSAIGVLAQAQKKARVTNLRDLGQSGVPAMVATMAKGDSLEASAELFTTINALMVDAEGSRSRTATEALNVRLAEFSPQRRSKDSKGKFNVSQQAIDQFSAAKTTTERIAVMRQNADLRRSFLGSASFELGAQSAIDSLLTGDDRAMSLERGVQAGITAPNAANFEQYVGELNSLGSQVVNAQKRSADNVFKQLEISDTTGSQAGLANEIFDKTINKVDFFGPDSVARWGAEKSYQARLSMGQSAPLAAAGVLTDIQSEATGFGMTAEHLKVLQESAALLRQIASQSGRGPPENALGRQ